MAGVEVITEVQEETPGKAGSPEIMAAEAAEVATEAAEAAGEAIPLHQKARPEEVAALEEILRWSPYNSRILIQSQSQLGQAGTEEEKGMMAPLEGLHHSEAT